MDSNFEIRGNFDFNWVSEETSRTNAIFFIAEKRGAEVNHRLLGGYFAEPNVLQFGTEIDVATFEEFEPFEGKNLFSSPTLN
jgi:hypothetical protein